MVAYVLGVSIFITVIFKYSLYRIPMQEYQYITSNPKEFAAIFISRIDTMAITGIITRHIAAINIQLSRLLSAISALVIPTVKYSSRSLFCPLYAVMTRLAIPIIIEMNAVVTKTEISEIKDEILFTGASVSELSVVKI